MRLLIVSLVALACFSGAQASCAPGECDKFFGQGTEQAERQFKSLPIEEQFKLFKCGMREHPPLLWPAAAIADEGETVIPFLVGRLREEENESAQDDTIFIFDLMSSRGHLHGKPEVVDELKRVVGKMKDAGVRKGAQEKIERIEKRLREAKD